MDKKRKERKNKKRRIKELIECKQMKRLALLQMRDYKENSYLFHSGLAVRDTNWKRKKSILEELSSVVIQSDHNL